MMIPGLPRATMALWSIGLAWTGTLSHPTLQGHRLERRRSTTTNNRINMTKNSFIISMACAMSFQRRWARAGVAYSSGSLPEVFPGPAVLGFIGGIPQHADLPAGATAVVFRAIMAYRIRPVERLKIASIRPRRAGRLIHWASAQHRSEVGDPGYGPPGLPGKRPPRPGTERAFGRRSRCLPNAGLPRERGGRWTGAGALPGRWREAAAGRTGAT